jgi:hypothetical protein
MAPEAELEPTTLRLADLNECGRPRLNIEYCQVTNGSLLVASQGFEPRYAESESAVLPLNEEATD